MSLALKLPVGNAPDWETKETNEDSFLNSIFDSSVLHHSLRQSRNAWLNDVFPKFTSRSKAKGQNPGQPPHNLRFVSKCDIEIGPHIFPETSVYEAQYLTEPLHYGTGSASTYPSVTAYPQTTSGTYSYPLTSYSPYVGPAAPSDAPKSTEAPASTTETKDPALDVTPALIAQVNEAAATNPTLHNLLQIAAAGEASMDQLRTLGFFIQSLATAQQHASLPPAPSPNFLGTQTVTAPSAFMQAANHSPPQAIPKKSDLVLEFRENHTERFLVPREIVACEQEIPQSQTFRKDIVLYTFIPFFNDESKFKATGNVASPSRTSTVIRLLNVADTLWETVRGWVNEEAKRTDAWDSFYDTTEASGPRSYLQYRLPDGDLLSQLRDACKYGNTMKPIKPAPVSEMTGSKRRRSRKTASHIAKKTKATDDVDTMETPAGTVGTEESASAKEAGTKRRRATSKAGHKSATGAATNGLLFINTMAPLELYPQALGTPVTHVTTQEHVPQASENIG